MLDWLTTPLSGGAPHALAPSVYWHARSMVLAWGVLIPLGALVARFYKVLPSQRWPQQLDNPWWWHAHRGLQYGGVALMTIGFSLVWSFGASAVSAHAADSVARWHAWAGGALFCLGWIQVVGALLRGSKGGPTEQRLRGDHYDMTPWRRSFERLHKGLGWLAVLGSLLVIVSGLTAADAPRWMLLAIVLWWIALTLAFARLQSRGRCIDTYQAIWGPDPKHPGNQVLPTGWGVRRP